LGLGQQTRHERSVSINPGVPIQLDRREVRHRLQNIMEQISTEVCIEIERDPVLFEHGQTGIRQVLGGLVQLEPTTISNFVTMERYMGGSSCMTGAGVKSWRGKIRKLSELYRMYAAS